MTKGSESKKNAYGIELSKATAKIAASLLPVPLLGNLANLSIDKAADHLSRVMSEKESQRLKRAMEHLQRIMARLNRHDKLREDGFFTDQILEEALMATDRCDAAEILEGALIKILREHEERKIPYILNIYANACFADGVVSLDLLNMMLEIAEGLSYRQLGLLALLDEDPFGDLVYLVIGNQERGHNPLERVKSLNVPGLTSFEEARNRNVEILGIIKQVKDLEDLSLLASDDKGKYFTGERAELARYEKDLYLTIPVKLTLLGRRLVQFMGLHGDRGLDGIPVSQMVIAREMFLTFALEHALDPMVRSPYRSSQPELKLLCKNLLALREELFGREDASLVPILVLLGIICGRRREGYHERAIAIAEMQHNSCTSLFLARFYLSVGQTDKSEEIYQSLVRKDPSRVNVKGYLDLLARMNRVADAEALVAEHGKELDLGLLWYDFQE